MASKKTTQDKAPKRLNFATYPQEYFTGTQVRVYFGGIWVDDVATIQYQTNQSKTPLFGYNDHQFRSVAKGQFMVNGNFTLAFKETGYLRIIMDLIKNDNDGVSSLLNADANKSVGTFIRYLNTGLTPEEALDRSVREGRSQEFGGSTAKSDFEDIAEVLEDSIWGRTATTPPRYMKRIPRSDELDYNKYTSTTTSQPNDIDTEGFDLLISFGDYRAGNEQAEHTMIAINEVHITGESLIVSPSADPVGITYTFFARGLNERVSSSWTHRDQDVADSVNEEPTAVAVPTKKTSDVQEVSLSSPTEGKVVLGATLSNRITKVVKNTGNKKPTTEFIVKETEDYINNTDVYLDMFGGGQSGGGGVSGRIEAIIQYKSTESDTGRVVTTDIPVTVIDETDSIKIIAVPIP